MPNKKVECKAKDQVWHTLRFNNQLHINEWGKWASKPGESLHKTFELLDTYELEGCEECLLFKAIFKLAIGSYYWRLVRNGI